VGRGVGRGRDHHQARRDGEKKRRKKVLSSFLASQQENVRMPTNGSHSLAASSEVEFSVCELSINGNAFFHLFSSSLFILFFSLSLCCCV
ncbi:MAG: hypothetical protein O7C56_05000, partial [Rickettsia endosymbiont of Ixodes persulcatus]|nr:hypothetical protein [Rickettsia endosymbiont of Ixodes persulcatus]